MAEQEPVAPLERLEQRRVETTDSQHLSVVVVVAATSGGAHIHLQMFAAAARGPSTVHHQARRAQTVAW
jgi:hypothetical protein